MEDQIRLGWTSHQGTILSVFDDFLSNESLVDVTLACEGQYIRAHKVILSACSPYFHELLNLDMNKHPILFLKDVKLTELKALLQFMYRGEVNIAREDFTSLLAVAHALQIRGLAEVDNAKKRSPDTNMSPADLTNHTSRQDLHVPRHTPESVGSIPTANNYVSRNPSTTNHFAPPKLNSSMPFPIPGDIPSLPTPSISPTNTTRLEPWLRVRREPSQNLQAPYSLFPPSRSLGLSTPTQPVDPRQILPPWHEPDPLAQHSEVTMLEERPVTEEELKVEEIVGTTLVDLTDDDDPDNSMSQSSFPDSWQIGEGVNSGTLEGGEDYEGVEQASQLDHERNASSSSGANQQRLKRKRTSFKQSQLGTLRAYFRINQTPDHNELMQLSQDTGLSKLVIQVWFQNARAKWRKKCRTK